MQNKLSLPYYERHATDYFNSTKDRDMEALYALFLPHIPKGGKILDGGCGSGRDALFFKEQGYEVTAFDGSASLAQLAEKHTGLNVKVGRFQDLSFDETFDGIWTSASLLHIPKEELPAVLIKLKAALKPGGVWYLSFRIGEGECFEKERYFNDQTKESLQQTLDELGNLKICTLKIEETVKSRRGFSFVSAVVQKL
jgi:2-polyprenyl-3-methyl-5-hydroxy-6-metoxy-1,4-benzoquinol methylase